MVLEGTEWMGDNLHIHVDLNNSLNHWMRNIYCTSDAFSIMII